MRKGFGVIELLLAFLLISILVAGFMKMTLMQMHQTEPVTIQEAQTQADEMIWDIQDKREQSRQYEEDLLDGSDEYEQQEDVPNDIDENEPPQEDLFNNSDE